MPPCVVEEFVQDLHEAACVGVERGQRRRADDFEYLLLLRIPWLPGIAKALQQVFDSDWRNEQMQAFRFETGEIEQAGCKQIHLL